MNDQYYKLALTLIDNMSNEEIKAALEKAGFEVTVKAEAPAKVVAPKKEKKKRKTKQDKLDQEARTKILSALNDFISELSDISNDTGYQIPDLHANSLACLHRELRDEKEEYYD